MPKVIAKKVFAKEALHILLIFQDAMLANSHRDPWKQGIVAQGTFGNERNLP
jgi:hypothetical protein